MTDPNLIADLVRAGLIGLVANAIAAAAASGGPVDAAAERRRARDRERKRNVRGIPQNSTKRGEKLPPNWKPNSSHYAAGEKLGFRRQQVDEQAEDMRLWAQANEHREVARKSDWDLTFLGWLRRSKPNGRVSSLSPII